MVERWHRKSCLGTVRRMCHRGWIGGWSALHPDDKDRVTRELERVADSGGRTWAGHYRFRRQDGSYASVLDRGYIIHDATGKPARVVGGISDISERRQAEEALESSRRQLRALTARLQSGREEERAMSRARFTMSWGRC